MNIKQFRLLLIGMVIGIALTCGLTSGIFNEAGQYKESLTAWCGISCK
jgi:hypothetical protein